MTNSFQSLGSPSNIILTRVRLPRSNPMAVAGSGERPGGVEHSLWNGVELEVFGDAEAGLSQAGKALFQLPYTWV